MSKPLSSASVSALITERARLAADLEKMRATPVPGMTEHELHRLELRLANINALIAQANSRDTTH
jgi:hypothetical protein